MHPLVQHKLTELRKRETSKNHFRQLLREISLLLAYEITNDLSTNEVLIQTPLEKLKSLKLSGKKLALISILRAGNGLLDGVLDLIPSARVGFLGLYRDEKTLKPVRYYYKVPKNLNTRDVILLDPMLATGNSAIEAVKILKESGAINISFLCLLAAPEGISNFHKSHPEVSIVTAAVDRELNDKGYILPGLGDAGDRLYGTK
tara:strand:- start:205 stop:813 length:609 start_codon:yes stop_codon:yes gene_type:complete